MSEKWTPERIAELREFHRVDHHHAICRCSLCTLAQALDEIERLQVDLSKERRIREMQQEASERFRPCSDHNGKVGISYQQWECQWCRAERAEEHLRKREQQVDELKARDRDLTERDQRREQLLRECLRYMDPTGPVLPGEKFAAKIRAELGDAG